MFTEDDFHWLIEEMSDFDYYQTSGHSPDDFRSCPVCNGLMEIYREEIYICGSCDHRIDRE
jgi:hypothetical protein